MDKDLVPKNDDWKTVFAGPRDNYSYDIKRFIDWLGLRPLDFLAVQDFIGFLEDEGYSPATINKNISAIKHRIRYLFESSPDYLDANREREIEHLLKQKIKGYKKSSAAIDTGKALSIEEIRALTHGCSEKLRLVIRLLFNQGLRISEAIDIRLTDIDDRGDYIAVQVRGKGRKYREIKMSKAFLKKLTDHFRGRTWLLETTNGNQYRRESLGWQIADLGKKVLGKKISPHTLRHSFAYHMRIVKKMPLETLSAYLGHAGVDITASMYLPRRSFTVEELPDTEEIPDPRRRARARP